MLFTAWFGTSVSEGRGALVFGDVFLPVLSHASIDDRSYVWPSIAMTGSSINSMEIGQTSASGGAGRAACVAAGAGAATAGAGRGGCRGAGGGAATAGAGGGTGGGAAIL